MSGSFFLRKVRPEPVSYTHLEVADALETGQYGKKPVIGFASEGSEHGQDNIDAVSYTHLPIRKTFTLEAATRSQSSNALR